MCRFIVARIRYGIKKKSSEMKFDYKNDMLGYLLFVDYNFFFIYFNKNNNNKNNENKKFNNSELKMLEG